MTSLDSFLNDLRTRMWRTAGARFNASRRLKQCNHLSALAIALLSSYVLAISIGQIRYVDFLKVHDALDKALTIASILGSLLIIIVSLTEWARDFSVHSERIFDNATRLTNLRTKLELIRAQGLPNEKLCELSENIRKEFEELTGVGSPNHNVIDDLLFRSRHYKDNSPSFKMCWLKSVGLRTLCHLSAYWYYLIAIIAPPFVIAFTFSGNV